MRLCIAFFPLAALVAFALAADRPVAPVVIGKDGGRARLMVDGKAFEIKGAGGSGSIALLQSAGGNALRTWGIDETTPALLDEASRHGIKVALGFWLGHERHGFDYSDEGAVNRQANELLAAVEKFKNHPALFLWGVGNEMEGFGEAINPSVFMAIENLARRVKELDPFHPVMTVTAEIGKNQVEAINRFCPSVDIHGINSYGGIVSLPERYRKAGGVKPYVVAEYGPPGVWETQPNLWGMPDEKSSTDKADYYRKAYQSVHADPLCLGSFAFLWGSKQETTATWFGMLLPGGEKLACVDALTELWTGRPPANRCPAIASFSLKVPNQAFEPGAVIEAELKASDPEGDALSYQWTLAEDWKDTSVGGDHRPSPPVYPEAILHPGAATTRITLPPGAGGNYRLYGTVLDGKGGAATANLSLMVKGSRRPLPAEKLTRPVFITGGDRKGPWAPSGWMGDTAQLVFDEKCLENPQAGPTCTKVTLRGSAGWAGIAWQHPANDWGDGPGGFDLSGAAALSFWARGAEGGEKISVGLGLIGPEKPFHDSVRIEEKLTLARKWAHFRIELKGRDLSRIKTPFFFSVASPGKPVTFFIDEAVIE